jgi:glycosyltransferase involved in cell wall biosynthesis
MWSLEIGGSQRAVYQLVREQRRRGVASDVVVASAVGPYGELVRESGALVHELACRGAWDALRSARLTHLARSYDIVHVHSIEPLLILATALARRTTIYTHRGGLRTHGLIKRIRLTAARPLVRRFSAISANTKQSARALTDWLGCSVNDVTIVYNGLDFDLLNPSRAGAAVLEELPESFRDAVIVGTAAKLQPLKRVELLIEAIARTREGVVCVVLGDGPSRPELQTLAASLGVAHRVAFVGQQPTIADYLPIFDLFVLPSGPEEAFGNAAVEAMGAGVPTIVFADGGGLTEHIEDRKTGRIVSDVEDLAARLDDLARDDEQRVQLGTRGREYVRSTYSIESMFERYRALYRRALSAAV